MYEQPTHTPGLLRLNSTGPALTPDYWIDGADGLMVLMTPTTTTRNAARVGANARRAVAAWNACEGIQTEELQAMAPGSFPASLTVRSQACEDKRRAEAEADRAALAECFAALEALTDWGRDHTGPRDTNSPHQLLIAACNALDNNRARVNLAASDAAHRTGDKRPGWVALVRARVATYGPSAPLDDVNAAELLAEIDAKNRAASV